MRLVKQARELTTERKAKKIGYQVGWWLTVLALRLNPMKVLEREIKLRAERRAGELLAEMEREKPGEYKKLHNETFPDL
jgi:hypothetical protein